MSTELRPCPFCGGNDTVLNSPGMTGTGTSYVSCLSCDTEGPYFDEEQEALAISSWNTRADDHLLSSVRKLVGEWRLNDCDPTMDPEYISGQQTCADQLESLLAQHPEVKP